MGGGLMQLVAYGAQDIYLTGNPQITFFKVVYRRHTNFSMEAIEQTINGSQGTTSGGSGTVTISRNGDLVHKIYVTSTATGITDGDELVADVELEIGGQRIDRHYAEWMQIWNELSTTGAKADGLKSMQGCVGTSGVSSGTGVVQVPLQFWFCRNPGLALPLIALQYHEVKLKFNWGAQTAYGTSTAEASNCSVICDYIYLDTDERRRFAQVSHEYLIEQVQRQAGEAGGTTKLNFNHPVKELIWTGNTTTNTRLKLNGHDRFSPQPAEYFQLRQPYDYHTAVPRQNLPSAALVPTNTLSNLDPIVAADHATASGAFDGAFTGVGSEADVEGAPARCYFSIDTPNGNLTNPVATFNTLVLGEGTSASADFAAAFAEQCPVGTTLAIIPTQIPEAGDLPIVGPDGQAHATPDAQISEAFFAQVLSTATPFGASNGGRGLTVQISTPTTEDGTRILTDITDSSGITDVSGGSVFISKVPDATGSSVARTSRLTDNINVYSFALKPEEHQPSGTCNFSRIDVAQLIVTDGEIGTDNNIYAVNYNVLRIMSGMGGLAYSN